MNVGQRGAIARLLIDSVREHTFPYAPRPPAKIDWAAYDVAHTRQLVDMFVLTRDLVDAATSRLTRRREAPSPKPGRPPIRPDDVAKVLIVQSYFHVPNRVAEGLLLLASERLGLREDFSYKTIERGYDREAVDAVLDEVFTLTNEPVRFLEKVFAVDGTGTPTSMKRNYAELRRRQRAAATDGGGGGWPGEAHDFVYNIAVVGVRYKLIAAWRSRADHRVGELSMFPEAALETKGRFPDIEMVVGDGLYAVRPVLRVVGEMNALGRFLPRRNVTLKRGGTGLWVKMLLDLTENPQAWLRDYYQREAAETVNSVIHTTNPGPLRKKLDARKETESYLQAVAYNVKRLAQLRYLVNLRPLPSRITVRGG